ncbi:MAG: hypothetical protein C5B50_18130 [Verrucomicrobia bacterium]|nr:MAG: hypothetical protein C5B50_18130 [Verrucomicrobiota bacterium]
MGLRSASAADITGTVTYKGTPPAEKEIDKSAGEGCTTHGAKGTTHHYFVGANGEFGNVTIYLEGQAGKNLSTGASAPPVVLDQKDCEYTPVILAVQTGQKLKVKNSDPTTHNVHVQPAEGSGNKGANPIQPANSPDLSLSFDKPEMFVKVACDVHNWMFAWVSVFDHPYFAVSAKDGTFKISNVPAGKYTIVAEHRKAGKATQQIEVKDGGPNKVEFVMPAEAAKSKT